MKVRTGIGEIRVRRSLVVLALVVATGASVLAVLAPGGAAPSEASPSATDAGSAAPSTASETPPRRVHTTHAGERLAPGFSLPDVLRQGERVTLSEYSGRPVVVNFFASWCVPCRKEMSALETAYQRHRDSGLVVIGVGARDGKRPVIGFAISAGVTFPVVWDGSGEVSTAYGLRGMPTTYFIDATGIVRNTVMGALKLEQLGEQITAILD